MKSLCGLLLLVALSAAHAEESAQKIAACLKANVLPGPQIQQLELSAVNINGETRVLKGRLLVTRENLPKAQGLLRAMLKLQAPDSLAGAAYLMRESETRRFDSLHVYLPYVKRVRRISAEFSDGALLGTNFSYSEFKQLVNAFGDLNLKLEAAAKYEDRDVDVVLFTAQPGDSFSNYSSVRVQVDHKTCVPLTAEFYRGKVVRKRFSAHANALKQSKNYWYLSELEMRDLIDETHTVLRVLSLESVEKLPGSNFDPATFYLGN